MGAANARRKPCMARLAAHSIPFEAGGRPLALLRPHQGAGLLPQVSRYNKGAANARRALVDGL